MADTWQSARLIYRAVEKEDEPFLELLSSDPEAFLNAAPFLPVPQGKKAATSFREFLETQMLTAIICLPAPAPLADLGTTPKSSDNAATKPIPIGFIHLIPQDPKQVHHRRTEIGINITKPYRGSGYGTEAINWALDWGFRHAGLHRIGIGAFEYNEGACKLYEKMGFKPEGRRRDFFWHDGKWWDLMLFSMLEDEWRERIGK